MSLEFSRYHGSCARFRDKRFLCFQVADPADGGVPPSATRPADRGLSSSPETAGRGMFLPAASIQAFATFPGRGCPQVAELGGEQFPPWSCCMITFAMKEWTASRPPVAPVAPLDLCFARLARIYQQRPRAAPQGPMRSNAAPTNIRSKTRSKNESGHSVAERAFYYNYCRIYGADERT